MSPLGPRLLAEGLGTGALAAIVVGSGIMGEQLAQGNAAVALLANAFATGAGLYVLITALGPISGAHLNPAVSAVMVAEGELSGRDGAAYGVVQVVAGIAGVLLAHTMFDLPVLQAGTHARTGIGQWIAEGVATFGLLGTILTVSRRAPAATPTAVALYIVSAYWFTASTSFANPGLSLARAFTDTFASIRLLDVPGFAIAQLVGAALGWAVFRTLSPRSPA